jgi:hypothetical protein
MGQRRLLEATGHVDKLISFEYPNIQYLTTRI